MQRIVLAAFVLFMGAFALADDRFEVLTSDDLIRSGLELELSYASDLPPEYLGFELTVKRGSDRFTIPCRALGSFVENSRVRAGYQRAFCQSVKYRTRSQEKYEILTMKVEKIWSKPDRDGRKSNSYTLAVDLEREYATRGTDISEFTDEAKIIFGTNFKGKTVEGAKTRLRSFTGRSVDTSPIRLMNHLEQAFTPVATKGPLMYSHEVGRSVRAWGFTYHIGSDYKISLSGRWGDDGRSEAGISQDLSILDDQGYLAGKKTLADRLEAILRTNSQ